MDGNSYEDWQIVAEQYAAQVKLYADHIELWSERLKTAGLPEATKAFERAVLALGMAYNEMLKASDMLHAEHDHFHVEAFNVGLPAQEMHDHDHPTDERSHDHHAHVHAHPHSHA
ncbi:MAG: hypothetical protein C7B47_03780 [Sulfobacillus thermosulfidooxidans]|uniref:Uncharacterized protein n=1 Tax=Sulfobacillus thermosulfidooxidans TaxID=28034 RepID=A0A2T2X2M0_SULTH|nr:MAG: hypothetical protein C7B47_03780 [Sulfobacillus thermosulfidooxidans]